VPKQATWSEPIMSAFGDCRAIAWAFSMAKRSAKAIKLSFGCADSSISGDEQSKSVIILLNRLFR